ncbi:MULTISPECIES: glycosyltransferase family 2 protein [unclassified Flavobacterium]|uniref:glycosyltransferase family 2 protein n=1 Tax=unclassified Flavobacterium TaxID=196869 RepID=UPI003F920FF5
MTKILISIIVPCYNQAQYLPEALQSVLDQTYSDWECIIVNDGSPDDTDIVAKEWLIKDIRFKYIYKENGGLSSARNAGIEIAIGDFIQFLDADDILDFEKLEKSMKKIIDQDPLKSNFLIVTTFKTFETDVEQYYEPLNYYDVSNITFESILNNWDFEFTIPIHCGLFSKQNFQNFNFPETLKAKEDWVMWLSILKCDPQIIFINEALVFYRMNGNGMTRNEKFMLENYFKALDFIGLNILSGVEYQLFLKGIIVKKTIQMSNMEGSFLRYKNTRGYKLLEILKKNKVMQVLNRLM